MAKQVNRALKKVSKQVKRTAKKQESAVSKGASSKISQPRSRGAFNASSTFNTTRFNLILGVLIVLVSGVLVFSFMTHPKTFPNLNQPTLTHNTLAKQETDQKYTVQDGDTLYQIAQKYYNNGYAFPAIAKKNELADPDVIQVGQILDIPRLSQAQITQATASATPASTPQAVETQTDPQPAMDPAQPTDDSTSWGDKITGSKYIVQTGDWLSKIAGRAYGDIYAYAQIAQANGITDPNNITPGTILVIPR